jgi:hypothetical protein
MNRRDLSLQVAVLSALESIEKERGVTIIHSDNLDALEGLKQRMSIPIINNRVDDFTFYNPNPSKRGSNFTPKKKKRKKH